MPSFYNIISNDEDTLKIVVQIMNGMSASAAELQKYLSYWDKYKYIWENDKARLMQEPTFNRTGGIFAVDAVVGLCVLRQ